MGDPKQALDAVRKGVYIDPELNCNDPIEESVFTSPHVDVSLKKMCCFCGTTVGLKKDSRNAEEGTNTAGKTRKAQTSRPYCPDCRKDNLPRYPRTRGRGTKNSKYGEDGLSRARKRRKETLRPSNAVENGNVDAESPQNSRPAAQLSATTDSTERRQLSPDVQFNSVSTGVRYPPSQSQGQMPLAGTRHDLAFLNRMSSHNQISSLHQGGEWIYSYPAIPHQVTPVHLQNARNSRKLDARVRSTQAYVEPRSCNNLNSVAVEPKPLSSTCPNHNSSGLQITNSQIMDINLSAFYCAAGPEHCFFFLNAENRSAAHTCKNSHCPNRHLGLHNFCNILRKRPDLLPSDLAFDGPELTFFCSENCVAAYVTNNSS